MIKKCQGCGYTLQSDDSSKLGYVPKTKNKNPKLCERCFKIIHYNDAKIVTLPIEENKILNIVNKSDNHSLFLIDFLNINEESIKMYKKINTKKTLIISKSDIIPFSMNQNKIIDWLQNVYKIKDNIIFLSAKKNKNINLLINYLKNEHINKAYLLGFTNAGKSSLINSIINGYELTNNSITTSMVPNTTLDFMNIKINDNLTLIDSPGFTMKNDIFKITDLEFIKKVNPKTFLKPVIYQLKSHEAVLIEDKIIIENNSDTKNSFIFYMSNSLNLKKIFNCNKYNFKESKLFNLNNNSDIVVNGLGFVNVKKQGEIIIKIDNLNVIEIRDSLF